MHKNYCHNVTRLILFSELVVGSLESGVLEVHNEHRSNAGLTILTWNSNLGKGYYLKRDYNFSKKVSWLTNALTW